MYLGGSEYEITNITVGKNGRYSAPEGVAYKTIWVEIPFTTLEVTENGEYFPEPSYHDQKLLAYWDHVIVNVPPSSGIDIQEGIYNYVRNLITDVNYLINDDFIANYIQVDIEPILQNRAEIVPYVRGWSKQIYCVEVLQAMYNTHSIRSLFGIKISQGNLDKSTLYTTISDSPLYLYHDVCFTDLMNYCVMKGWVQ